MKISKDYRSQLSSFKNKYKNDAKIANDFNLYLSCYSKMNFSYEQKYWLKGYSSTFYQICQLQIQKRYKNPVVTCNYFTFVSVGTNKGRIPVSSCFVIGMRRYQVTNDETISFTLLKFSN